MARAMTLLGARGASVAAGRKAPAFAGEQGKAGLGRGLTAASDSWTIKIILGKAF